MCSQAVASETSFSSRVSISTGGECDYGRFLDKTKYPNGLPLRIENLAQGAHDFLQHVQVPKRSNISFDLDGIPFQACYTPTGDKIHLSIWATLGYLPYSVHSIQKRRILINILNGVRSTKDVQFGVNAHQQIIAKADYTIPNIELPTFIFMPLINFIQHARPIMQLIGEAL